MPNHSPSPHEIAQLADYVTRYIREQRERYRESAIALFPDQVRMVSGYFSPDLLAAVRVHALGLEPLDPPAFLPHVGLLQSASTAFTMMAAITFADVIVSRVQLVDSVLFHELVHCEQYRQLGIEKFAQAYVRGYLESGGYDGIPLEEQAYMLAARFEFNPDQPFSVERDVALWRAEHRY